MEGFFIFEVTLALDSTGATVITASSTFTWASSNTAVATVSSSGDAIVTVK